jgi:hypothetical protein
VESWSLKERKREWVREMVVPKGCQQSVLSRDGKYLACYRGDYALAIIEVATGTPIFEKKEFYRPDVWVLLGLLFAGVFNEREISLDWLNMGFSPDGRYLIAAHRDALLVYDFTRRAQVSLPGKIADGVRQGFTFLSADRIAVTGGDHGEKSAVLHFPTGERLATMILGRQKIASANDSRFLLLRPIKENPVGMFDWAQNKLLMGNRRPALDVYNGVAASEARDGTVALSQITSTEAKTIAWVQLPERPLAGLRITQLSDDLNLLALSLGSRGAVFDLQQGKRLCAARLSRSLL